MDKWTELRTAFQVAKLGTVSAASEALGLHRATVNRHIDALEAEMGGKIFIRHARGYTPTEIGDEVLRVAQKTEEMIEDLAGRVKGGNARIEGEIKLTILAPFAGLVMEAVAAFQRDNPLCQVHVDVGEGLAKLEYGEAHIALRAGARPDHPDYVVSHFCDVSFNLYAHDSYLAQHPHPFDIGDVLGHRFVLAELPDGRSPFATWVEEHVPSECVAMTSPDFNVTLEAISNGIGIGFVSDDEAAKRGQLRPVMQAAPGWAVPGWIVTHVDLHRTEKVQGMLKFIKTNRPMIPGR